MGAGAWAGFFLKAWMAKAPARTVTRNRMNSFVDFIKGGMVLFLRGCLKAFHHPTRVIPTGA
jgi:hypothetical protein